MSISVKRQKVKRYLLTVGVAMQRAHPRFQSTPQFENDPSYTALAPLLALMQNKPDGTFQRNTMKKTDSTPSRYTQSPDWITAGTNYGRLRYDERPGLGLWSGVLGDILVAARRWCNSRTSRGTRRSNLIRSSCGDS